MTGRRRAGAVWTTSGAASLPEVDLIALRIALDMQALVVRGPAAEADTVRRVKFLQRLFFHDPYLTTTLPRFSFFRSTVLETIRFARRL